MKFYGSWSSRSDDLNSIYERVLRSRLTLNQEYSTSLCNASTRAMSQSANDVIVTRSSIPLRFEPAKHRSQQHTGVAQMWESHVTFYDLGFQPHSFGTEAMKLRGLSMVCCTWIAQKPITFYVLGVRPHSFGTKAMWWAFYTMDCWRKTLWFQKYKIESRDRWPGLMKAKRVHLIKIWVVVEHLQSQSLCWEGSVIPKALAFLKQQKRALQNDSTSSSKNQNDYATTPLGNSLQGQKIYFSRARVSISNAMNKMCSNEDYKFYWSLPLRPGGEQPSSLRMIGSDRIFQHMRWLQIDPQSVQQCTTTESSPIASLLKLWGGSTRTWNVAPRFWSQHTSDPCVILSLHHQISEIPPCRLTKSSVCSIWRCWDF